MEENESLFSLSQTFLLGSITMMKRDVDIISLRVFVSQALTLLKGREERVLLLDREEEKFC